MASRRLPASRTRANTNATTIPAPRPPSRAVMSKSIASSRDDANAVETSIQVVIRCRRRSEREIQDNSPIIVSSSGAKSQEVTIESSVPISSLGVVTLPPTKTYPFDLVFGPEADQAMIYHDVVGPLLSEVLQGYNCTLFAYGQTGTGKTYTMQGDLIPTPMGNPSAQAGMIPRVLFRLFHELETTTSDYSVKISFVELYNEELRDLLANDLAAPSGSTQPMDRGNKDVSGGQQGGLKIFDDSNKKGVFIQGLEEMCVKDAADALALLTKGSQRRQIAATKFNDHSSRSHSVFTITVHVKETSAIGDDLLKVGKLNLVDLAGSENIGRSGAENTRAREAGMINQSLLTLGRVINALVDRSQHVPYRESKLTRLLRDSLGGHTKTCIIATVSPARSNMEETLSTLDYAFRAKSIHNKPEVNQRMTRNALLKEYVAEIERLKADVLAAREKNGIFFSEETWNQLSAEQELRQTEMEEARKQVEIVESQMRSVREEFEQSIALLIKRDGELKMTKERLREKEGELVQKVGELENVKGALEEEVVVRRAYQGSEGKLDGVAIGLKHVVKESVSDLGGLFEKLERKTSILSSNSKAVLTHGKTISSETKVLTTKLEDFIKTSTLHTRKLRNEADQLRTKELEVLAGHSERINQQLQRVQETMQLIQGKDEISHEAITAIQAEIKSTQETLKSGFVVWSESLRESCEVLCKELQATGVAGFNAVEKALHAIGAHLESIIRESCEFVESERRSALEAKALAHTAATAEITRLREQNALLTRLLESEKEKTEKAKNELILRVGGLLGDFTAARDRSLREAVEDIKECNGMAETGMSQFNARLGEVFDKMTGRGAQVGKGLETRRGEGKRMRDGTFKTLATSKATFNENLSTLQGSVANSISTQSDQIRFQMQAMSSTCGEASDRYTEAKRARTEATTTMATNVQSEYRHMQRSIASTSRNIDNHAGRVVSESADLSTAINNYHKGAATQLSSTRQATRSLVEQGAREDAPTGKTPRKRVWEYVDQWELTKGRDAVLKAWRVHGVSNSGTETQHPHDRSDGADIVVDKEPEDLNPLDSLMAASLASSASSGSIPIPLPVKMINMKSDLPIPSAPGTLLDLPTNVITERRPRRAR